MKKKRRGRGIKEEISPIWREINDKKRERSQVKRDPQYKYILLVFRLVKLGKKGEKQ